jgi:hypothetical protein
MSGINGKKKIEELGRVSSLNDGTILPIAYYNSGTDRFVTRGISFLDFVANLPTPGGGGGGDVLYSNTYFVDAINGNDGTAVRGNFNKPYQSVMAAIFAAQNDGATVFSRALVSIRSGEYYGNVTLLSGVDIYCDHKTIFYGEMRDGGAAVNVNVYGHAVFKGTRALYNQGNSTINLEFDYADVVSAFVIASPPTESTLTFSGNYIRSAALGTGYGNSLRGKANMTMTLRDYGTCVHSFLDIRNSYSGKLRLYAPEIILENGDLYGSDYKNCIYVRAAVGADIKIYANLVNKNAAYTSAYGLWAVGYAATSYITLKGDITALDSPGMFIVPQDDSAHHFYEGNITTTNTAVIMYNMGHLTLRNTNILQDHDSVVNVFEISTACTLQLQDVNVISNSTTNNIFNCIDDATKLYAINTYVYKTTGTGQFTNGNVSWDVRLVNCMSNIDMNDATTTNLISSTGMGFAFDTQFKLTT